MYSRKLLGTMAIIFAFSIQVNAQFTSGGPGKTVLTNTNDRVGIGATTNANSKVYIKTSNVTYGQDASLFGTSTVAGSNINGNASSRSAFSSAYHLQGNLYGHIASVNDVTKLRSPYSSSISTAAGGAFSSNVSNLTTYSVAGSKIRLAGTWSSLNGTISSFPSLSQNAIAAAVIGEDNINSSQTYAGYFKGKGYFTDAVTIQSNLYLSGNVYTPSDAKLKKEVKVLENAMDIINDLSPKQYKFKTDEFSQMSLSENKSYGLISQEVEEVLPEMVKDIVLPASFDKDGAMLQDKVEYKSVDYISLIPILIKGMQEQSEVIKAQNEKITALENFIGTSTGSIFKNDNSKLGNLSAGFEIEQNQPNPFSNSTTIKLNIPENTSEAMLVISDLSGKQLKEYPITQNGQSEIEISLQELGSGTYLYTLISDGNVIASRKMILAK